ncbi:MAG: septum formation inhibitor Maf [Lachnospiraceae bacterium]|nr:septum formation inhibitor Maf [Lachnospiraceae bacterium]
MKIVLASASPRRSMILEQAGIEFEVCVSDIEEKITQSAPELVVEELSAQKAEDVAGKIAGDALVLGADTVVAVQGKILGKPKDEADAVSMLKELSGRVHQVYTGVTLIRGDQKITFHAVTDVTVCELTEDEIQNYVNSGEPMDKAGAYAIQGLFGKYITGINGEYNNVVGLPIAAIYAKCRELGYEIM